MEKHNLAEKSHNGYIYERVTKEMYGIPQEGRISHDTLVKHLDTYGYHPSIRIPGLLKHNSRPINFSLVVDNFGVKYPGKDHALHLKSELETKYKVTTDWESKLYIGIELKCDHGKGRVKLSMPGYVHAALHAFQHEKPKKPQDSPYPWAQTVYRKNNQMLSEKAPDEELDENNQKRLPKIVGKLLYYDISIDPPMLMALNSLEAVFSLCSGL